MREKKEKKVHTSIAALPSALGALLVISAVAFGGSVLRPLVDETSLGQRPSDEPTHVAVEKPAQSAQPKSDTQLANKQPDQMKDPALKHREPQPKSGKVQPTEEPKPQTQPEQPKPEPTAKPQPKPTAKPQPKPTEKPKPVSATLEIWTGMHDGKLKVAWSAFEGDGFSYYKVLRSTDAEASWPTGAGDELIAAIADRWSTKHRDGSAPCNTQVFYRVFAVTASDHGYQVLASSPVAAATLECAPEPTEPPKPAEPYAMWFSAEQVENAVVLNWEVCGTDGFAAYKVVRSTTNDKPTFPLNEGSELLAAIGDPGVTTFTDGNVQPGVTYFYRVLSMGNDGSWYALGVTSVATVSVADPMAG